MRLKIEASVIPYAILALVSGAYLYPFVRELTDAPDTGVFLNGAAMVVQGAIPSRDFVEPAGPGSFLWLALFFRLFGTTLKTAQMLLSATGIGMTLLVFHLSRRLGNSGLFAALFVLAMSVPLLAYPSAHYDSNLFALAAFALFLPAWTKLADGGRAQINGWLMACGTLAGFTSWFIQQKGLYLLIALAACLVCLLKRRALPPVAVLSAAYAAALSLQFMLYAVLRALPDLVYANYLLPFSSYSEINAAPYGFPIWQKLWPSFFAASRHQSILALAWSEAAILTVPFLLVMALPLVLPGVAFIAKANPLHVAVMPYWFAAYALWLSELHRVDIGHLRNGCVLMVVLLFAICAAASNRALQIAGVTLAGCLVVGAVSHLSGVLSDSFCLQTRRGVVYSDSAQPVIDFLQAKTKAGDDVFIYPYQPAYYFLEGLQNPTRYSCLLYHYNSRAQFLEAVGDLERKKVRYVLYDDELSGPNLTRLFPAYRQPDDAHLIMEPYLAAHYRELERAGRFQILERR